MQSYQNSLIISPESNDRINRFNSKLESVLAVSVFISSFLVLSAEKNWWGGHLSWSDSNDHPNMASFYNMR